VAPKSQKTKKCGKSEKINRNLNGVQIGFRVQMGEGEENERQRCCEQELLPQGILLNKFIRYN